MIVVDTLSRSLAGGNENASDDMGAFVQHCDELRAATGAHVLVIHHTGKDDSRGARGHSLLKAAADTEIEVKDCGNVKTATFTKQRDLASEGETFAFKLQGIELDERQACVLVPADAPAKGNSKRRTNSKAAKIALQALEEAIGEMGQISEASNHIPTGTRTVSMNAWRKYAYARGISGSDEDRARQQAFKRGSEILFADGLAQTWNGQCWTL